MRPALLANGSRFRAPPQRGRTSAYRGVSQHAKGRWEARVSLTVGLGGQRKSKVRGPRLRTPYFVGMQWGLCKRCTCKLLMGRHRKHTFPGFRPP